MQPDDSSLDAESGTAEGTGQESGNFDEPRVEPAPDAGSGPEPSAEATPVAVPSAEDAPTLTRPDRLRSKAVSILSASARRLGRLRAPAGQLPGRGGGAGGAWWGGGGIEVVGWVARGSPGGSVGGAVRRPRRGGRRSCLVGRVARGPPGGRLGGAVRRPWWSGRRSCLVGRVARGPPG